MQQRRLVRFGCRSRLDGPLIQQCRKVVVEDEDLLEVRIPLAAGALVARTQRAGRIVRGTIIRYRRIQMPLPGALVAVWGHLHPLIAEGIVAPVRL